MLPAILGAVGIGQAIGGLIGRAKGKKGIAAAEKMFTPYKEDVGIADYYNKALQQATATGLDTVEGRLGQQKLQRSLQTALAATKGQRGRGVENILRASGEAQAGMLGNLAAQRRANLGMLGQAAGARAAQRAREYQYNVLAPAERKYRLEAQRMAEGGSMIGRGLGNILSAGALYEQEQKDKKK